MSDPCPGDRVFSDRTRASMTTTTMGTQLPAAHRWPPAARPLRRHALPMPVVALHKGYSQQAPAPRAPQPPATAADFTLECLSALRRGELSAAAPFLPVHLLAAPDTPVLVAGVPVLEQGPLARCAPVMDAAARRVLPGHLLRRARVLSSLMTSGDTCLQRVALSACTGEELVLTWRLQRTQQQERGQQHRSSAPGPPTNSSSSSSSDGGSSSSSSSSGRAAATVAAAPHDGLQQRWAVRSIAYDASAAADASGALPLQPHPRHPPETIIMAQLAALRAGDLAAAARFNVLGRHHTAGWQVQLAAFQQLVKQPACRLLVEHAGVQLASAACPLPRQFLQEVLLTGRSQPRGDQQQQQRRRYLWRMAMHADGCWLVKAIEAL